MTFFKMKPDKDIKKELEEISPLLAKLKKEQSQPELPANFFNNLQVDVIQELRPEFEKPSTTFVEKGIFVRLIEWVRKPQVAMAFGVSLLLIGVVFFIINQQTFPPQDPWANLSDESILEYLDENIDDFEAVSLMEISEEEEEVIFDTELDDNLIDQYLEDNLNQIDESDLF